MDPKNFNPFSPDWQNSYYAMLAQQQAGQGGQPEEAAQRDFEEHLEEAGQQDAPDHGRRYAIAPDDAALIRNARNAACQKIAYRSAVVNGSSLRKLSEALQQRYNLSLNGLSDVSLKDYAKQLFPGEARVITALGMLRAYREGAYGEGASGAGTSRQGQGRRYDVVPEDAALIHNAGGAARGRLEAGSISNNSTSLRRLSGRLQQRYNLSLNGLSDESLKAYARELCPDDPRVQSGVSMLKRYRETLGEGTSHAAEGSSRQPVQQPSPEHESSPSRVSSYNQDQLWGDYDAVQAAPGGASPQSSPSRVSSYNQDQLWGDYDAAQAAPGGASPPPIWQGMNAPSPAPTVNQPGPSDQGAGAWIFGAAHVPSAPPAPDLAIYVPGWQHGDQRAPEDLMRGMHYMGVLPSPSQPQTNFTIGGVPYTAALGPSGRQNDIIVFYRRN
ncbi:hypothetical protein ACFSQT_08580 [Mesorhizobium calcicola]|uniref:Uncharacterized protein n=2 Tax=Mesorhizobium TaxID=68287 RepID=A0ABW4WCW1_9HYPH